MFARKLKYLFGHGPGHFWLVVRLRRNGYSIRQQLDGIDRIRSSIKAEMDRAMAENLNNLKRKWEMEILKPGTNVFYDHE